MISAKHITLLTDGIFPFSIGGMQKHSYHLAKEWARQQVSVTVIHPHKITKNKRNRAFSHEELQYLDFQFVEFPSSPKFPGHYLYNSFRYAKNIYLHLKGIPCERIYAQGFTAWYFLKKNPFDKRIITNLHGLEMYQWSVNSKNKLEHKLLRIASDFIIKNSFRQISLGGKLTSILNEQGAKPSSVIEIPNAIDAEWIQKNDIDFPSNGKRNFVFVGRYELRKGIELINQVINKFLNSGFEFSFSFIGDIPKEKQIQTTDKSVDITYLGSISEPKKIREILIQSDVLVCPSFSEGMPTVILEAMACRCAIIATDVGAVSELVGAENGILISPGNIAEFELAFKKILSISEEELSQFQTSSFEKIQQNFLWSSVARKTLQAFEVK
ncbi:MAG: glycosyltransferase family 4 protein [Bacteroidia bacterium]|nr:glycosyltransferase family 4 protein [Bacteroidia bacterium]MCO5254597.1 glycosyltransferase family 4 protein [Bacteroidota bacterium]